MAAQRTKHTENQIRGLQGYSQLKECPSCGKVKSKIKESRKVFDGVRRRYECLECDHRHTTYEISLNTYEELTSLRHKINQLHQIFADLQPPLQASENSLNRVGAAPTEFGVRIDDKIPCADCVHMKSWGCSFDLPEAESEDACGCNLFKANISDNMLA